MMKIIDINEKLQKALELRSQGLSSYEISQELGISEKLSNSIKKQKSSGLNPDGTYGEYNE